MLNILIEFHLEETLTQVSIKFNLSSVFTYSCLVVRIWANVDTFVLYLQNSSRFQKL